MLSPVYGSLLSSAHNIVINLALGWHSSLNTCPLLVKTGGGYHPVYKRTEPYEDMNHDWHTTNFQMIVSYPSNYQFPSKRTFEFELIALEGGRNVSVANASTHFEVHAPNSNTFIIVKTATFPSFAMALTSHGRDYNEMEIRNKGGHEPCMTQTLTTLLYGHTGKLVVDVGANLGYYGLLAAALGHEVQAFEALASNHHLILNSVDLNEFHDRMTVHHLALANESGSLVSQALIKLWYFNSKC